MITVVNKYHMDKYDVYYDYCGRGTPLGNPYTHLNSKYKDSIKVKTREESIDKYREYFKSNHKHLIPFVNDLYVKHKTNGYLRLCCFCSPKPCHCDVIKEYMEKTYDINNGKYTTAVGDVLGNITKYDAVLMPTNGCVTNDGVKNRMVMDNHVAKGLKSLVSELDNNLANAITNNGNITQVVGKYKGTDIISFPVKPVNCRKEYATNIDTIKSYTNLVPGWGCKSSIKIIRRSLHLLSKLSIKMKYKNILSPLFGCDNGDLSWSKNVKKMIDGFLDDKYTLMSANESDFDK